MDALGYAAGVIGCATMLPQLVRILKTRDARDVSAGTLAVAVIAQGLWEAWGVSTGSLPVIATSAAAVSINVITLGAKLWADRRRASGRAPDECASSSATV